MTEVIELRVHGVGGATPERILGEENVEDTIRSAGDKTSAFFVRKRDLRVEGYVWGKLTSRALLQPLWLLLLPFTLMNLAGWMHPPRDRLRAPWMWPLSRYILRLTAYALTLAYALWLSAILIEGVFYQWGLGGRLETPTARVAGGAAAMVVLGLLVLLIARATQRGFEGVAGPDAPADYTPAVPETRDTGAREGTVADLFGWLTLPVRPSGWRRIWQIAAIDEGLDDDRFWDREAETQDLLYAHVWAGVIGVAVAVWLAWEPATRGVRDLPLEGAIRAVTVGQVILVLLLTAVHVAGWRAPFRDGFRWCGPAVAASTAIGLSSGFLYGLLRLAQQRLPRAPLAVVSSRVTSVAEGRIAPDEWRIARPALELGTAFGIGAAVTAVAALGLGIWVVARALAERRRMRDPNDPAWIPANTAPPGREPNGVLGGAGLRLALARAGSDTMGRADVVLTAPAVAFAVVILAPTDWFTGGVFRGIGTAGDWLAVGGAVLVLYFLARRANTPDERRIVGIVWDVMTFWPRRNHPLAVRPYAERSVPELRHRLYFHTLGRDRRVLLSSHSQGTVLAFAALAASHAEVVGRVSLLTYGSPLYQLYRRFFPTYFPPDLFEKLEGRLFEDGAEPAVTWHNFYRRTDYVGKAIFRGTALAGCDQEIPEPTRPASRTSTSISCSPRGPTPSGPHGRRPRSTPTTTRRFWCRRGCATPRSGSAHREDEKGAARRSLKMKKERLGAP